jgi:hypothetical protein
MLSTIETTALEIGRLRGVDPSGRPLVSTTRSGEDGLEPAWLGIAVTERELTSLIDDRKRVLLGRAEQLDGGCVIVGILRERALPEPEAPRELVLEATERLIVRCGTARIVLHGDGRCEIHAERISQRARGVHAIKGAAVRIN